LRNVPAQKELNIMNMLTKLKGFLEQNNAPYGIIVHEEVFTAQELAQALHTPGRELVKVVVVKADDSYVMAVLPAIRKIDLRALKEVLRARTVSLAPESDLTVLFPDAEVGAMPPFGNLYNIEVFADESLAADEHIVFNAGTHYEAVRMRYDDFARLARPHIARFAVPIEEQRAA
jgi:Ala-tRNA(Pro) deacylase